MKTIVYQISFVLLASIFLGACKTLDTTVSIATRPLPVSFGERPDKRGDSATIAGVKWNAYFTDSLLVALIDTALRNNFDARIAFERIETARAGLTYAKGELLPKVAAGAGAGVRKFGTYTMEGAGNAGVEISPGKPVPTNLPDLSVGLQSSWEIDIWGKLSGRKEAAAAQYLASVEGARSVTTLLIAEVASAYYDLVGLDNELDILRRAIQTQQEALGVIQLKKEAGKTNELAVQQFQTQLLNAEALEQEVVRQITAREYFLNFLLGGYPQPLRRQKETFFSEFPLRIESGIPSQLLQNRPDIREAELRLRAAKFDTEAAKAAFYPSLTITAGMAFQAFDPQFLLSAPASLAYNALGGLLAPIFNRGALEAQFDAAKSAQIQALLSYQKTVANAYAEVATELFAIETLRKIHALKSRQTEVSGESVKTSIELYKAAKAGYLEVLIAQQQALQTQLDLVAVKKRQKIAIVTIYKALGGGWK